jgi:hypothetical protein
MRVAGARCKPEVLHRLHRLKLLLELHRLVLLHVLHLRCMRLHVLRLRHWVSVLQWLVVHQLEQQNAGVLLERDQDSPVAATGGPSWLPGACQWLPMARRRGAGKKEVLSMRHPRSA